MRGLAFACFLSAAIDWPGLWLDRAGVALLGLAFVALALAPRPRRIRRPSFLNVPPAAIELEDELADDERGVADRIADYLATSGRST